MDMQYSRCPYGACNDHKTQVHAPKNVLHPPQHVQHSLLKKLLVVTAAAVLASNLGGR